MSTKKAKRPSEARQQKPLCLGSLAEDVLHFIQERTNTTFQEVADMIVSKTHKDDSSNEKTTRRRVYDVLNVFAAAGLISKEARSIKYQPLAHISELDNLSPQDKDLAKNCEDKRTLLMQRIKLLLSYKALIMRNKQVSRPVNAVQMPVIMVGFNNNILGESYSSLDGKSVEMSASEGPIFYSPMDVFSKLQFPVDLLRTLMKEPHTRGLEACEDLVFQD